MKIFTPDIKLTDKLTKYISPASIEKARFQKYNAPKINDGNLLCDKFFRTSELFDRDVDEIKDFCPYGVDDLPVYDRASVRALDLSRFVGSNKSLIETNLPYYVDIIGENKRIYLESYGCKNPKYPAKIDASGKYEGFCLDDIVNIKYHAKKVAPKNSIEIEEEGLQMIKNGFPLESVINVIKEAALQSKYGVIKGSRGLMQFLLQFPKLRHYMITESKFGTEVFDVPGAKRFPELVDMCKNNTEEAYEIIKACRIRQDNRSQLTDIPFLDFAKTLYKIDNTWTKTKSDIINFIKDKHPSRYTSLMKRTKRLLEKGVPIENIEYELTPIRCRKDLDPTKCPEGQRLLQV